MENYIFRAAGVVLTGLLLPVLACFPVEAHEVGRKIGICPYFSIFDLFTGRPLFSRLFRLLPRSFKNTFS